MVSNNSRSWSAEHLVTATMVKLDYVIVVEVIYNLYQAGVQCCLRCLKMRSMTSSLFSESVKLGSTTYITCLALELVN